jgi:CHAD domain-containing protein
VADEIVPALNVVWSRYRRQLRRAQRRLSMDAVHDLRVQTRRLLACLDLLAPAVGSTEAFVATRQTLGKRLDTLGALRDAHVQLTDLDATLAEFPEMTPLHRHLRRRANRLSQSVGKKLARTGISKLSRRVSAIRRALAAALKDASCVERLRTTYAQSLDDGLTALAAVRADHFQDEGKTHDVRIVLKHLRYGAEGLPAAICAIAPAPLQRLKKCVAALGRIHDIEVHVQRIAKLEKRGRLSPLATAAYRTGLARCRKRLVSEAMRLSHALTPAPKPDESPADLAPAID